VLGDVLTASVTPFDSDGSVNLPRFRELAVFLVENGSDGLVVTGTTGESPTLTDDERFSLYEAAVETIGARATVVAGTGTYDTRHSVHLTEKAHELGVDGFLVVTPYYNKPPPRGIVEHVKAIAAVTDKPIVYYNIPARVVNLVSVETLAELAEIPNVVAVLLPGDEQADLMR
jgi:4-hydroxy-tetrahydrodipicolinate synthase